MKWRDGVKVMRRAALDEVMRGAGNDRATAFDFAGTGAT